MSCLAGAPHRAWLGTELWTLKRVGLLIEQRFGVSYNEARVRRILDSLGFSPQRPDRRAIERDEDAVLVWKQKTWPALKKVYAGATADCLH
ncbi:winged helix-turn-helix domain-containing protein [Cupriavidus basilensis]|nr:winged helix-turn-helix domain-containing protein [Cupriavidus basilensis]